MRFVQFVEPKPTYPKTLWAIMRPFAVGDLYLTPGQRKNVDAEDPAFVLVLFTSKEAAKAWDGDQNSQIQEMKTGV